MLKLALFGNVFDLDLSLILEWSRWCRSGACQPGHSWSCACEKVWSRPQCTVGGSDPPVPEWEMVPWALWWDFPLKGWKRKWLLIKKKDIFTPFFLHPCKAVRNSQKLILLMYLKIRTFRKKKWPHPVCFLFAWHCMTKSFDLYLNHSVQKLCSVTVSTNMFNCFYQLIYTKNSCVMDVGSDQLQQERRLKNRWHHWHWPTVVIGLR